MSSPVVLAGLMLAFTGVTHLLRPDVWRDAIRAWASVGPPGVATYGLFHALPGGVLVALSIPPESIAGAAALLLGAVLTVKGVWLILSPERSVQRLLRATERSVRAWRAPGLIGLAGAAAFGVMEALGL